MRFSKETAGMALFLAACAVFVFVLVVTTTPFDSLDDEDVPSDGIEIQISPVSPSTTDGSVEQFLGGCPPDGFLTGGEESSDKPPQKIDPRLFDLMQGEMVDSLGETHRFVQARAFCLFIDDDRVKGVVHYDYSGLGSENADPFVALSSWMNRQEIDRGTACKIDWDWNDHPCEGEDPVEEVPQEEEEQQEPEPPSLLEGGLVLALSDFSSLPSSGGTDAWEKEKREK